MATWTLSQIRQKVRQVTGRLTPYDLTNDQLDTYINQYYQFTFPAEVKLDAKQTYYTFMTTVNQVYYDQPLDIYTNFEPPATVENLNTLWYQNPADFFDQNPLQYTLVVPWTGDGVTTAFSTTVTGFPIFPGTTTLYDGVELFRDTNQDWTDQNVNVTGSLGGTMTINYATGVVGVGFASAPTNGANINLNYVVFQAGRPQAILMYNNQFQLWPPPDQAYVVQMVAWKIVEPLVNATDQPYLPEWGPTIAYGAARDIFADYGEMDAYATCQTLYEQQLGYILTRTEQNLLAMRAQPQW